MIAQEQGRTEIPAAAASPPARIYLVRHAHADWTPDGNRPLSARGHRDARRVADLLQPYPIAAIYSSPSRRARQTVEPLAVRLGLPIDVEPALRERRLCEVLTQDFWEAVRATWEDRFFAHAGGESNAAAQERAVDLFHRLGARHPGEPLVLATHGNLLALLAQSFDPSIGYAFWKELTMPDVYRLCIDESGRAVLHRLWPGEGEGRQDAGAGR